MRTMKIYSFEELSADVQKMLIDQNRDINNRFGVLDVAIKKIQEEQREKLKSIGFVNPKIYVNMKEGVQFICESINIKSVLTHYKSQQEQSPVKPNGGESGLRIVWRQNYAKEDEMGVCLNDETSPVANFILKMARNEMKNIYDLIRKEKAHLNSDQGVRETLIRRNIDFAENGYVVNVQRLNYI